MLTRKMTGAAIVFGLTAGGAVAQTLGGLGYADAVAQAPSMAPVDDYTLQADDNLLAMPATGEGDTINAIVEIPTGTSAKWEINPEDHSQLYWEYEDGAPRIVNYLGYPGNYGSIPGTALPEELGGDGDPLDVVVLGQAAPRGTVLNVRLIGVLRMTDTGEQDDKMIAVMTESSPFAEIESLQDLDRTFPGVSDIVATWFVNYKGPNGGMESQGYAGAEEAREIFNSAVDNYEPTN